MNKRILLAAAGLLLLAAACTPGFHVGGEGEDYFEFAYIKWARSPISCYMGNIEGEVPEGFSVPTQDQMKRLIQYRCKYYGHYNDTWGMLISARYIDGFNEVLVADDGSVAQADFRRYAFTDEHLAHGVFLPVNDNGEGYYWSKYDNGDFTYMVFSMLKMKTERVANGSPGRILSIKGGMLPVKN